MTLSVKSERTNREGQGRMLQTPNKGRIIGMKQSGMSNRAVARETGNDRHVVSKIWSEYRTASAKLKEAGADIKSIQAEMMAVPKYRVAGRHKRKYTDELDARLREIAEEERGKTRRLGAGHKQMYLLIEISTIHYN
jgi:hypothetical protein